MIDGPIVRLVSKSDNGTACCAAAARISTTPHPAHQLMEEGRDPEKDKALIGKVLASGHRSLIEHFHLTYSLDGVSVFAEQFLIEFRLGAFTVKSRRYVDFEGAGYYAPHLEPAADSLYRQAMDRCFADYGALVKLGVPKEDARFVLPYCFYSSLFLSANAREMAHLIGHLRYGRGAAYPELKRLGELMAQPFDQLFPGVLDAQKAALAALAPPRADARIGVPAPCTGAARLLSAPQDGAALLDAALSFSGRLAPGDFSALVNDARPRELELLQYAFSLRDVSLACVTHIARHRIQSPLFAPVATAVNRQRYVLPATVAANPQALTIYQGAFAAQSEAARRLVAEGLPKEDLGYLALSGLTVDLMTAMNARELLHFIKLRTCARAQWEIRRLAGQMLGDLQASLPALFNLYGPSCAVTGYCPEGRLSCGRAPAQPPVQ